MMRLALAAGLLLGLTASPALANQIPKTGRGDPRMRTVVYQPNNVVHVSTAVGAALVVTFSPSEKVTAVAVTNSKDLIANPRDNFLFLKPKAALSPQPVIVLTAGPRGARRYVLEVQAQEAASMGVANPAVYYSVQFAYPGDVAADRAVRRMHARALAQEAGRKAAIAAELARAHSELNAAAPLTGARNWRYVAQGDRALQPVEVMDNGASTAFRFPANTRVPGMFRIDPDGKEAAVGYSVRGDYVVVGSVASGWRLRDGATVLCIFNRAYDRVGQQSATNTASPAVTRLLRSAPL